MKTIRPWTSVVLGCICLLLTSEALGQSGPLTWSSYVTSAGPLGPYDSSQPATSDVVSRFTPTKAIKVSRIEIQAAEGAQRFITSPTFVVVACTQPLGFKIT